MYFLLVLVACGVTVFAQTAEDPSMSSCPVGWTAYGNSCYGFINHGETWADAQATCAALGGFLAEIYNANENKFIQTMAQDHNHQTIWLGADDLLMEGTWTWAKSGAKVEEYTDWAPGQPDNDDNGDENCMEMNIDKYSSHWNDDECDHHQRFICQRYMSTSVIG